ncbi:MAG: energy transducer TonB, partial [Pyrinomonadaceae bacterium]
PTVDRTVPNRPPSSSRNTERQTFDERRVAMLSVNRPDVAPIDISTKPNPDLPIRDRVTTLITGRDVDGGLDGGRIGTGGAGVRTNPPAVVIDAGTPPPTPTPKPKPPVVSKGVITSEAISLPKPVYPPPAKAIHAQGKVSVQVLIDETGRVVSAKAIDGHPLLKQVSEKAAYQARFSPTLLGDQPVKVSGVITYNFLLQE